MLAIAVLNTLYPFVLFAIKTLLENVADCLISWNENGTLNECECEGAFRIRGLVYVCLCLERHLNNYVSTN